MTPAGGPTRPRRAGHRAPIIACRLANAAAGSAKNITPKRDSTTSNGAPPVCHVCTSATTHSIGAASAVTGRDDAAAIMSVETSAPTTLPPDATRAAA